MQVNDTIRGTIKIDNLPDLACFESFEQFAKDYPNYLSVEIPRGLENIIVGNEAPNEDQRDAIWVRRDPSGNVLGFYLFQKGQWRPAYTFAPGEIIWMVGDSRNVPEGFLLVDAANGQVPTSVSSVLEARYIYDTTNTYYIYFAVTFVGF